MPVDIKMRNEDLKFIPNFQRDDYSIQNIHFQNCRIHSLDGIENYYLVSLHFDECIFDNPVFSLSGMNNIQSLTINDCNLEEVSINNLGSLTDICIGEVTNFELYNLDMLNYLFIKGIGWVDLKSDLPNLESLTLNGNIEYFDIARITNNSYEIEVDIINIAKLVPVNLYTRAFDVIKSNRSLSTKKFCFSNYKKRIRRVKLPILKPKIISLWNNFFYQRRNKDGFNRFSFLAQ